MLTNRINRLTVRNYRSLADVTVDFEDLTVLVGPNGSGKSNILDVLRFVRDALRRGLDFALQDRSGIDSVRYNMANEESNKIEITLDLTLGGIDHCMYGFVLESTQQNQYRVQREFCSIANSSYEVYEGRLIDVSVSGIDHILDQDDKNIIPRRKNLILPLIVYVSPFFYEIESFLTKMSLYSIFPDNLRLPQLIGNPYPLSDKGENLASVLRDFIANPNNTWQADLYQSLATIIPHVSSINPLSVDTIDSYLITKIKHTNSSSLSLSQESDGTRRVLALLAALYQQPPRHLIGIEEPELTIYPRALESLCEVIDEASRRSQIILTTHSPELINYFKADSLRAVGIINGATQIGRIREDQRQVIAEQLYKGGDLLMLEGLKLG